jgi:glycosyltransferase involved in cell wall biosynthesis
MEVMMRHTKNQINIAFLSTFPPRECGIATFTEDLITAIDSIGTIHTSVIAINNAEEYVYDKKVMTVIRQEERQDYIELAAKLNSSKIQLLIIEHEYGIYGGENGEYLLDLINHLEIPFITTCHTILSEPTQKERMILHELGLKSEKVITMANNTKEMLQSIYGIAEDKIEFIHHGVPRREMKERAVLKKQMGYEFNQIISTFGLIGPGKGIEHGIEAIGRVVNANTTDDSITKNHDDVLYLILGQTHPALKEEGTAYRKMLEALVDKLNLGRNVKFVNKYLTKNEIINYLQLSDIYMTPYLGKDQAVSGTLAYAVGYGKAIVSTPYLYAQEMLSTGNGLLGEFNNPESLSDCMRKILENPMEKERMERETLEIGKTMYWDYVAQKYLDVVSKILHPSIEVGE